jgi:PAS domain S-box-containing protein
MISAVDQSIEARVLFAAPTARDAQVTCELLARVNLHCVVCRSLLELTEGIAIGAGAVLLTDDALTGDAANAIVAALAKQPAWSDLPVVMMTRGQAQSPAVAHLLRVLTNVTLLERPAPTRSVVSAVQSAVRGRLRQYLMRQQFQTIREAEERLAFSMEAGKLGSWEVDLATTTMICSARCKENFGRDPKNDFTYQDMFNVIHPDDRQRVANAVQASMTDRTDFIAEYRIILPDSTEQWVYVRGRAMYTSDGTPLRMAGVSLNITDRKRIEQQRQLLFDAERAARSEAERVGRMKDEFLATLSHELRTPLNAILGWSHLLQMNSSDPEDLKEGLSTIERNARAQTQLIDDLLDMSRIISGKIRMEFKRIAPAGVIESAIATVQHAATAKGVKIETDVKSGVSEIFGDPGRLQQVVWNLLSNAIKFTPRDGIVRVRLKMVNGQVEIVVSDSGKGIDLDFLPHVFERFRQADAKTTREHGGLGLGLAIVKHLVELHGGSISVTSKGKGTGSTFTILLPVTQTKIETDEDETPHRKAASVEAVPQKSTNFAGVKVLVVDDELDARELMRRLLQASSASVTLAASAAEALTELGKQAPDLIISDIGMPVVDGYDLMRKVRALDHAHGGKVPAIALTAFARSEDRAQALLAGYTAHLTKPVNASQLLATVAQLTDRNKE